MSIFSKLKTAITTKIGIAKYRLNETTGQVETPHLKMSKVADNIEKFPQLLFGLQDYLNFILSTIKVTPTEEGDEESEKAAKWLEKWKENRKDFDNQIYSLALNEESLGNGYLECKWADNGWLDKVVNVPKPENIYYNTEKIDDEGYWILRVNPEVSTVKIDGKEVGVAKWSTFRYSPSSFTNIENMNGILLPKNKLLHFKYPYSPDGYYGHTPTMSSISDYEAMRKIIANIQYIAAMKATGRKVISVQQDQKEGGQSDVSNEDLLALASDLESNPKSTLLINKKIEVGDLNNMGTYDSMINEMQFLTLDTMTSMPIYMTPFSQSMYRGSPEHLRTPFARRINRTRTNIENFLNEQLKPLIAIEAKAKKIDLDLCNFTIPEISLYTENEAFDYNKKLFDSGLITKENFAHRLGLLDFDETAIDQKDIPRDDNGKEIVEKPFKGTDVAQAEITLDEVNNSQDTETNES